MQRSRAARMTAEHVTMQCSRAIRLNAKHVTMQCNKDVMVGRCSKMVIIDAAHVCVLM